MSEYLDRINVGGKSIKLHYGEPAVYSTDAEAQSIREVYVDTLTFFEVVVPANASIKYEEGNLFFTYLESSNGIYIQKNAQGRKIGNGVYVFYIKSFKLYLYVDHIIENKELVFKFNIDRCANLSYNPIISSCLQNLDLGNRLSIIENSVSPVVYTDNVEFNQYVNELYYTGIETKFRINYRGKVEVKVLDDNNDNVIQAEGQQYTYLSDGLNVFKTIDGNNKLYVICDLKSIKTNYEGNFTDSALDINCSPAIASYIASEKLIEEKLSSITNQ